MDRHTTTTMIGVRVPWDMKDDLTKIAQDRDTNLNAMIKSMLVKRVTEIREEEGW